MVNNLPSFLEYGCQRKINVIRFVRDLGIHKKRTWYNMTFLP
jgi:hypothetical protein